MESLRRSQGQDGTLIRTLTAWARDVHTRWPVLRLSETPPPLRDTINQPPGIPGGFFMSGRWSPDPQVPFRSNPVLGLGEATAAPPYPAGPHP